MIIEHREDVILWKNYDLFIYVELFFENTFFNLMEHKDNIENHNTNKIFKEPIEKKVYQSHKKQLHSCLIKSKS